MSLREYIDSLILLAVEILNDKGFETFESWKGGVGFYFTDKADRGTQLTIDLCKRHNKPCIVVILTTKKYMLTLPCGSCKTISSLKTLPGNRESI